MIQREILLLAIMGGVIVLAALLYFCCRELGAREKKRFKHTSYILREKELEEVISSKTASNFEGANEVKPKPKHLSGEDFYAGKDSLRRDHHHEEEKSEDDMLGTMLWGPQEDDDDDDSLFPKNFNI